MDIEEFNVENVSTSIKYMHIFNYEELNKKFDNQNGRNLDDDNLDNKT